MNDPANGLLAVAIAIFVFAVVATLFTGHQQRKYAALAEAEREAKRQAAAHPAS